MKTFKVIIAAIVALGISFAWAETVHEFYIFLPNNTTWKSSTPMINEDGKSRKLEIDTLNCGWYYRRYVDEPLPSSVVIHRDDDPTMEDAIGMNGAWEESGNAEPIPLNALFEIYSTEYYFDGALYFVADAEESQKLPSSNQGWYIRRPDVRGYCAFELRSIVYDTDASLHGAFSCTPDWNAAQTLAESRTNACHNPNAKFPVVTSATDELPCIGVTTGMVESTIDPKTKKMKLTDKGRKCFGPKADEAFAAMFTATPGVNESSCFNMPLEQNAFGRFSFNSDYDKKTKTSVMGGFYPTEESKKRTDSLPAARSNRKAEGPAYFCSDPAKGTEGLRTIDSTEKVPVHQLICNGPGWDGGVDCEGFFATGNEFSTSEGKLTEFGSKISNALNVTWVGDGWAWSCDYPAAAPEGWPRYIEGTETEVSSTQDGNTSYRWISGDSDSDILTQGGRNGHFCTESHAMFKYKKGLKFNISGSDDIWVYINNKLAVDLGGMHLPAPGNVDLDKFMPDLEIGKQYDVDIYTCNRRSRSSNLSITTNIVPSYTHRDTIWYQNFSCTGFEKMMIDTTHYYNYYNCCHIQTEKIEYLFTTDRSGQDPTKTIVSIEDFEANPIQFNGGINIEQPYAPIVNEEALKASLPNGIYYLVIKIGNDRKAIEIRLNDSEGIVNRRVIPIGGTSFSIMKTGALEFAIMVANQSSTKRYAVMDMKGQVVSTGTLNESATRVKVPAAGSYIVNVGKKFKQINMK